MSTGQALRRGLRRPATPSTPLRLLGLATLAVALLAALPGAAGAQPFGQFLLTGPTSGYVEVPNSSALNPTSAFTFEAWVLLTDANGGGCSSIAGKGWTESWWVGICGTTLRSYLKGSTSQKNGGQIPGDEWTHIAVVFDGAHRLHYINGELVNTFAETGPLTTSISPVRIGSDVSWEHTPSGTIDEVRLWNVARTQAQIRAGMSGLNAVAPGLVALWPFNFNANDVVGGHNGTLHGSATFGFFGTSSSCTGAASDTTLCLLNRFAIKARYRVGAPGSAEGIAHVVPVSNPGSGLFWFFDANNWEVMVKALNGCGLNSRYWVFSAATTNVYYRMEVFDYPSGTQRIYFNYPGPPAPAVTDTSAFATCP
jgi:concanavalin A-like lectin/glucanase superfamily protein